MRRELTGPRRKNDKMPKPKGIFPYVDSTVAIREKVDRMTEAQLNARMEFLEKMETYFNLFEIIEITYMTDKVNKFR